MSAQTNSVIRSYVCDGTVTKYAPVSTTTGAGDGLIANASDPDPANELFVGVALEDGTAGDRVSVVVMGPALCLVHSITDAGALMVRAAGGGAVTTHAAGVGVDQSIIGYYWGNSVVWAAGGPADDSAQEIFVNPTLTSLQ